MPGTTGQEKPVEASNAMYGLIAVLILLLISYGMFRDVIGGWVGDL